MRPRFLLVALVVLALAAVTLWRVDSRRTTYESALATLPADVLRATYTDWKAIGAELGARPVDAFVREAYDRDLSRTSALESAAVQLDDDFGIDLRQAEWEIYGQSDEGSVDVLRLGESSSFDELADTLRALGYAEPATPSGAWFGGEELVTQIDPSLTPVFQSVLLLEDESLVLWSDAPEYAEHAAKAATGDSDDLLETVSDLAGEADEPIAAVLWASDYACEDLAMSSADSSDQAAADALVDQAGGVTPVQGLLMAAGPDGEVRVALRFADDDQARRNLQPRTDLAAGEAPGLGGSFPDRFTLTSGRTDGRLVVLGLKPVEEETGLLSQISDGPVLFATC